MRRKALQAQETALDLRERLKPVLEALQPLTAANRERVGRAIATMGGKVLAEQKEAERQKSAERLAQRQRSPGKDRGGYSR